MSKSKLPQSRKSLDGEWQDLGYSLMIVVGHQMETKTVRKVKENYRKRFKDFLKRRVT